MTSIGVRNLKRSFGSVPVLRGIDLDVAEGSVTAILGASGCGKTTLLRLIAGFDTPDAGTITIGDMVAFGPKNWVPPQRRRIGYVAQEGALFPHLTVGDNIGFGMSERGPAAARRIHHLLELVDLDPIFLRRYPHQLSGGQQQRVALARTLAARPAIVLLDEPFASLDAALREGTRAAIMRALAATRTTAVLVTHDQAEALSVADQVAVMFDGELEQVGSPMDVYHAPVSPRVGVFLGEANLLDAELVSGHAICALGTLPLRHTAAVGRGVVLIRPEQVFVVPERADGAVTARVVRRTFYGSMARLELELPGSGVALMVRVPGYAGLPAVDDTVGLSVCGEAVGWVHRDGVSAHDGVPDSHAIGRAVIAVDAP